MTATASRLPSPQVEPEFVRKIRREDAAEERKALNMDPATFNYEPDEEVPQRVQLTPAFEAVWDEIKTWDVNVPTEYRGYTGASGTHVMAILKALRDKGVIEFPPNEGPVPKRFGVLKPSPQVGGATQTAEEPPIVRVWEFLAMEADRYVAGSGVKEEFQGLVFAGYCAALQHLAYALNLPVDLEDIDPESEFCKVIRAKFPALRDDNKEAKHGI